VRQKLYADGGAQGVQTRVAHMWKTLMLERGSVMIPSSGALLMI
jgi:hypothetical protein